MRKRLSHKRREGTPFGVLLSFAGNIPFLPIQADYLLTYVALQSTKFRVVVREGWRSQDDDKQHQNQPVHAAVPFAQVVLAVMRRSQAPIEHIAAYVKLDLTHNH